METEKMTRAASGSQKLVIPAQAGIHFLHIGSRVAMSNGFLHPSLGQTNPQSLDSRLHGNDEL
jgi:hypothetical protein